MARRLLILAILASFGSQLVRSTDEFEVRVKEHHHILKRSPGEASLSRDKQYGFKNFRFDLEGREVNLRLKRNNGFGKYFPIYEHVGRTKREVKFRREETALYHDADNFAAVQVSGRKRRSLRGVFHHKGDIYSIEATPRRNKRGAHKVKRVKVPHLRRRWSTFQGDSKDVETGNEDIKLTINGLTHTLRPAHKRRRKWSPKKKRARFLRRRRAAPPVYDVELDIVADCSMWKNYYANSANDETKATKDLADYISIQVNTADLVFKAIDPTTDGFSVNLFIRKLHILKSGSACDWTSSHIRQTAADDDDIIINSTAVLSGLHAWSYPKISYSSPDHVLLWTRHNLDGPGTSFSEQDTGKIGMAWLARVCSPGWDVSVVEDSSFFTWKTVAHEIAHNLGSPHDGDPTKNTDGCPVTSGFIMAPSNGQATQANIGNSFRFSPCSIGWMKFVLEGSYDGYPKLCLTNRQCSDADSNINRDVSQMIGISFNPDTFCEDQFGAGYFHDETDTAHKDSMCWQMTCKKLASQGWWVAPSPYAAPEGADCGGTTDKWCRSGDCVSKASQPAPSAGGSSSCTSSSITKTAPSTCTSNPLVQLNLGTSVIGCSEVPLKRPDLCILMPEIAQYCCKDCYEAGLI